MNKVAWGSRRSPQDPIANDDQFTERTQAEATALQRAALEAAANSIVITDRQGNITWVNKAFSGLTGYAFAEVVGQNPRFLKSGNQDPVFYEDLWRHDSCGKSLARRTHQLPQGWHSLHGRDDHHAGPCERRRHQSFHCHQTKIVTERRKIEAERSRLVAILEATPDFVGSSSVANRGLYVNRGGRELLGFGANEDLSALGFADIYSASAYRRINQESFAEGREQRLLARRNCLVCAGWPRNSGIGIARRP